MCVCVEVFGDAGMCVEVCGDAGVCVEVHGSVDVFWERVCVHVI